MSSENSINKCECGGRLRAGFKVCPNCGKPVSSLCPGCQKPIKSKWNVCPNCGTALPGWAIPTPMARLRKEKSFDESDFRIKHKQLEEEPQELEDIDESLESSVCEYPTENTAKKQLQSGVDTAHNGLGADIPLAEDSDILPPTESDGNQEKLNDTTVLPPLPPLPDNTDERLDCHKIKERREKHYKAVEAKNGKYRGRQEGHRRHKDEVARKIKEAEKRNRALMRKRNPHFAIRKWPGLIVLIAIISGGVGAILLCRSFSDMVWGWWAIKDDNHMWYLTAGVVSVIIEIGWIVACLPRGLASRESFGKKVMPVLYIPFIVYLPGMIIGSIVSVILENFADMVEAAAMAIICGAYLLISVIILFICIFVRK